MNRVYSRATRAGIATNRTANRGEAFSRSVVDLVPCTIATALVGVVEAKPMSDIMSQYLIKHVQCESDYFEDV